jgi:hypothetical protein
MCQPGQGQKGHKMAAEKVKTPLKRRSQSSRKALVKKRI